MENRKKPIPPAEPPIRYGAYVPKLKVRSIDYVLLGLFALAFLAVTWAVLVVLLSL